MNETCDNVNTQRIELKQKINKQISRELHRSFDLPGVKIDILYIEDCSIKVRVCLKEIYQSLETHVIHFYLLNV